LLDLDTSISYTLPPKLGSNKEQEAGDFMVSPIAYYYCIKRLVVTTCGN